jgi:4-diphosphocytidyl-2-C-methyl-D-erythritol kinase
MLYRDQNNSVTVAAPAKLNLFLKVLGKRSDGFHDLETLMVSVGLYDTLRLAAEPGGELTLTCRDAGRVSTDRPARELPPSDGGNLVLKAAELLRQRAGIAHGARLELTKHIPLAAGLAGGSSDAACALVGLNRLWRLNLPASELHRLAAQLGSDVPFFLCPTAAAICRGRGEIIEPRRLPLRLHFVIARPRSGLSTAEVFRHARPSSIAWSAARLADECAGGRLDHAMRYLHNDLQEPAERLNHEVTTLKAWFSRQPFLGHLMSGSGTSYFGLCHTHQQARQLAARLRATRLGDVFVARSRP